MSSEAPATRRRAAPVVTLLLLSPVIAEVLFGATRITTLFVLLPQIGTWGCAALIIRDLVRRRRRGWPAILLLGVALAVAEETVIQQTSLASRDWHEHERVPGTHALRCAQSVPPRRQPQKIMMKLIVIEE